MKKVLSCVLMFVLLFSVATAEGVKVVIPNKINRIMEQLPAREAQPVVRTKTKDGEIMVRVSGEPDMVYANWLGYGETKEEVELENGLGIVEIEGHKYQLGAKWNNKVYRSYFAYDPDTKEWVPVDYRGTVKVGNTLMKLIDDMTVINDMTYEMPWVWVYDYLGVNDVEATRKVSNPGDPQAILDVIVAGLPAQKKGENPNSNSFGMTSGTEVIEESEDVKNGKYDNQYWTDSIYDENGLLVAYNSAAFGLDGEINYQNGWTYMVPYYQFYSEETGKESNGAPNHAWIVKKGPWTSTYTRAGKLVVVVKNEENTDYFKTGLAGNTGKVTWELRKTKQGWKWYISEIVENYAEGDIAQAAAVYNVSEKLVRYFITYRTDENETYRIKYTPDNKPAYGNYTGTDYDGNTIHAYTASSLKWADSKTKKLADSVELDWDLIPLVDWINPPRLTR